MTVYKVACEPIAQPPSYISSRSANSLISFSHPTRIQASTLFYLNKLLDELLLHILSAARSLATDRIKTDGIVRVLGGQHGKGSSAGAQLARNAVLEAELELRNYIDSQGKGGGRKPLGLSATSRFDGTARFPVEKAYRVLRHRCQFHSALSEVVDPNPEGPQEENLLSSDGRPIATTTPEVAIYLASILEFVAEHILQQVAVVMEREKSDEGTLGDLAKALEEEEGVSYWWTSFQTREEMHKEAELAANASVRAKTRKPWQVPAASELDEAAAVSQWHNRKSIGGMPSGLGLELPSHHRKRSDDDHLERGMSPVADKRKSSVGMQSLANAFQVANIPRRKRRPSIDRGSRLLSKRRDSPRQQDTRLDSPMPSTPSAGHGSSLGAMVDYPMPTPSVGDGDIFDSLVLSGQTMKVSLTPNRLRSMTIEQQDDTADASLERPARKRPQTENGLIVSRKPVPAVPDLSEKTSKSPKPAVAADLQPADSNSSDATVEEGSRGPKLRDSSSRRNTVNKGNPPSAYRGLDTDPRTKKRDMSGGVTAALFDAIGRSPSRTLGSASRQDMGATREGETSKIDAEGTGDATLESQQNGRARSRSYIQRKERSGSTVSETGDSTMKKSAWSDSTQRVVGLLVRKASLIGTRAPRHSLQGGLLSASQDKQDDDTRPVLMDLSVNSGVDGDSTANIQYSLDDMFSSKSDKYKKPSPLPETSEPEPLPEGDKQTTVLDGSDETENTDKSQSQETSKEPHTPTDALSRNAPPFHRSTQSSSDTRRLSARVSPLTIQVTPGKLDLRKTPRSFSRQTSVVERRRSLPYQGTLKVQPYASSLGHHSDQYDNAPPSAWTGHALDASTAQQSTDFVSPLPTPRIPFSPSFSMRAQSPSPWAAGPSKTDVARILAQLNTCMRDATSVEECQRLVLQALAVTAAAVHDDTGRMTPAMLPTNASPVPTIDTETTHHIGDMSDEAASKRPSSVRSAAASTTTLQRSASPVLAHVRSSSHVEVAARPSHVEDKLSHGAKHSNVVLHMASKQERRREDSLQNFKMDGRVASWLLCGDEEDGQDLNPEVISVPGLVTESYGLHIMKGGSSGAQDLPVGTTPVQDLAMRGTPGTGQGLPGLIGHGTDTQEVLADKRNVNADEHDTHPVERTLRTPDKQHKDQHWSSPKGSVKAMSEFFERRGSTDGMRPVSWGEKVM